QAQSKTPGLFSASGLALRRKVSLQIKCLA
ncbi:MAG: hypothetical protein ACI96M_000978, partial [Candidatus Azotimanducaceae bacterium]